MKLHIARSVVIALAGLAVAAAAFGRSLSRAVQLDPVTVDTSAGPIVSPVELHGAGETITEAALSLAVENDPFSETRTPSLARYRLPGDVVERPGRVIERPVTPAPSFSVLGLVEAGDAGFAVVQTEDGTRSVVPVGEDVLGYRITKIAGKTATVTLNGESFELRVPEPEPHPAPPSRGDRRTIQVGDRNITIVTENGRTRVQSERRGG